MFCTRYQAFVLKCVWSNGMFRNLAVSEELQYFCAINKRILMNELVEFT